MSELHLEERSPCSQDKVKNATEIGAIPASLPPQTVINNELTTQRPGENTDEFLAVNNGKYKCIYSMFM